jgi:Transposase family tnp2
MKKRYIMMSLMISGPKQPGNNIDVFLAPMIEELKSMWEKGARVWDAYQKEFFTLFVMLLYIINDFSAYGNLSGFKTKGARACPICQEDTCSIWLKKNKKDCVSRTSQVPVQVAKATSTSVSKNDKRI